MLYDVLSGAIQMMNEASSMPHVRAGKLTLLNVNHAKRIPEFPDVPTLTELGYPNADGGSWFALYGIKGAPDGIFERLNAKLVEIGRSPQMQARLALASAVLTPQTLPEITRYLEDDAKITMSVIREANIKLE